MGLEKKLTQDGSSLSKANGGSIPTPVGATDQSTLQNTYSINGIPKMSGKPEPSVLSLKGEVPSYNYKDNAPSEGQGKI